MNAWGVIVVWGAVVGNQRYRPGRGGKWIRQICVTSFLNSPLSSNQNVLLKSFEVIIEPEDVSLFLHLNDLESRMIQIPVDDVISEENFDLPVGWQGFQRDTQIR